MTMNQGIQAILGFMLTFAGVVLRAETGVSGSGPLLRIPLVNVTDWVKGVDNSTH
jgi:hypothetical protein